MVGKLSLDFEKDGTVIMKPLNKEGTYEVEGDHDERILREMPSGIVGRHELTCRFRIIE
jgi:hypothetical protein